MKLPIIIHFIMFFFPQRDEHLVQLSQVASRWRKKNSFEEQSVVSGGRLSLLLLVFCGN